MKKPLTMKICCFCYEKVRHHYGIFHTAHLLTCRVSCNDTKIFENKQTLTEFIAELLCKIVMFFGSKNMGIRQKLKDFPSTEGNYV